MTNEEKFAYWLDIAQYDLQTGEAMFVSGRWLYVVFMCQQSIEKLVKGLYILYVDDNVPRLHDISNLLARFMDKFKEPVPEEHLALFRRLSAYYLETRYPEYKEKLSAATNKSVAGELLEKSKEAFQWLLMNKP
jgi:HEPN domain-containing protein